MKLLAPAIAAAFLTASAAAEDHSVFGTHWVKFEPVQIAGDLKGCSLVYLAVTADRAYLNGDTVAVNGSVQIRDRDGTAGGLMMTLKVGLKELASDQQFQRPAFAYLQTGAGSTAKANQVPLDGDPGYKLFAYRALDPQVAETLKGVLTNNSIAIGYNRKADGIDVLVPLDLTVVDSEYTDDQTVHRKRSSDVLVNFSACTKKVLASVERK